MPRSFNIALFSALILVAGIMVLGLGVFPFSWNLLFYTIGIALFGFGLSWIVKKLEKIEKNWGK